VVFSVLASDLGALTYQWRKDGSPIGGATGAELTLPSVAASDAGSYTAVILNSAGGSTATAAAILTVGVQAFAPIGSTLVNISTRAQVGTGANLMIAGFVVGGSGSKRILIRAVGPSLTGLDPVSLNAAVVLGDPVLQLTRADGTPLVTNDDWSDDPAVAAAAAGAGAFALQAGGRDSAMIVTLPPGAYTALVTGKNGTTGVALVEVYDLDRLAASRLINVSTRAQARAGTQSLIAGFVVAGSGPRNVLIRAVGPTLTLFDPVNLPAGVVLADPQLELHTPGGPAFLSNDDWNSSTGAAIAAAARAVAAFSLGATSVDSALLASLSPGSYTPVVTGKSGATGIALVEVYEAP
jgi:hypothetical protein